MWLPQKQNYMIGDKQKIKKGFTLIEMTVVVAVFSLLMVAVSTFFASGLKAQRQNLAIQELLDQTSYSMEYMSRALRMAKKDATGSCITAKLNYAATHVGQGVKFKNYQDVCQEFFYAYDETTGRFRLKEVRGVADENFLSPESLNINSFIISLNGQSQNDDIQPSVSLFLEVEGKEGSKTKVQTTISQRNLDVEK